MQRQSKKSVSEKHRSVKSIAWQQYIWTDKKCLSAILLFYFLWLKAVAVYQIITCEGNSTTKSNSTSNNHVNRKRWTKQKGEHALTPTGRTRKADLNIICKWIIESWNDIPSELISKSFRKCCITNALDGTEDNDVWQEDDDCDPFNDEDGGDDLYYAEELDREAAEIDEDEYDRLFGESDNEEFDGF